jgi:hypothetical protein
MNLLDPHVFFGLDLGKRHDPCALAVVERLHRFTGERDPATWELKSELYFVVRHCEVFRLGTPYLEVVRRMQQLPDCAQGLPFAANPARTLVVDATAVGDPVFEALQAAQPEGVRLAAVSILSSGRPHPNASGHAAVSRRDLLNNLRLLMERELLRVAPPHSDGRLKDEMLLLTERSGPAHDDRALALALAVWQATRGLASWLDHFSSG